MTFKKYIYFSFILFGFYFSTAQSKIFIGAQVGGTATSFRGNDIAKEYKSKIGALAGISFELTIIKNFSLITNVNYEQKSLGKTVKFRSTPDVLDPFNTETFYDIEIKTKHTLNYISTPVIARYYFNTSPRIYINAGVMTAYFINSTVKTNFTAPEGFTLNNNSQDESIRKFDWGIIAGIGSQFKLNQKNYLSIELRNNLGFANINRIRVNGENTVYKTNSINLILNWSFAL